VLKSALLSSPKAAGEGGGEGGGVTVFVNRLNVGDCIIVDLLSRLGLLQRFISLV
jgi:hypothetical protein